MNKSHWVFVIFHLLLCGEEEGVATMTGCVRHTGEVIVSVQSHNFGYIERFNTMVETLVRKNLLPPNMAELLHRQLRTAARNVCTVRKIQLPTRTRRPTAAWTGRMPRETRRQPRQAFLGGILAGMGLYQLGRTIEELLGGAGYGDKFGHYLAKIRDTEKVMNLKIGRMEERIKRLEGLQHASLIVEEMEALISIEAEEWNSIRSLDEDLVGNPILDQAFGLAAKHYDKYNYTKPPRDGPLQKIRIPESLRYIKVEVLPHEVCRWSILRVIAVTAIPTRSCSKLVGMVGYDNITLAETKYGSCLIMGSWNKRVELYDGSVMLPSNAWERKKTNCEEALKNKEVLFHENKGDVFLGSKGSFEARSTCGDSRKIYKETLVNKTVTPKLSCYGWTSINGLKGTRDEWTSSKTRVSAGTSGISGVHIESDSSWLFEAYKMINGEDEDEDEEEDLDELEAEDWDWSLLEKTSVGSATSLVAITALLVVGVLCWKKYGQKKNRMEQNTYEDYKQSSSEMEREDLDKLKDELDVIKTINNIVTLTGEGMEQMVRSLETMCATMEEGKDKASCELDRWEHSSSADADKKTEETTTC